MKLTKEQIEWLRCKADLILECLPENTMIQGNALASGDDAEDKRAEKEIVRQLESGNEWAWCTVKVTSRWNGFEGTDYLGCCSYKSEKDFRDGGYWPDMVATSFDALVETINQEASKLESIGSIEQEENEA